MEGHDLAQACEFATDRLCVGDWHLISERYGIDLTAAVTAMLSRTTTEALPPEWSGDYDADRANRWIAERDQESPTLLAIESTTGDAIGLLILFEDRSHHSSGIELRLGYLIARTAWGQGFATELIRGLVDWARSQPRVRSVSGGVATSNVASVRVLTKNGFALVAGATTDEAIYRLEVDR